MEEDVKPDSVSLDTKREKKFIGKSVFAPSMDEASHKNPFKTTRVHEKIADIAEKLNFTNSILSSMSNQQAFKIAGKEKFQEHKFNSLDRKRAVENTMQEVGQVFHFGADRIIAETALDIDPMANKQRKLELIATEGKQRNFLDSASFEAALAT
jgi:hypothetical protein